MSIRKYKEAIDKKSKIATRITMLVDALASMNNILIVPSLAIIREEAGLAVDFNFSTVTQAKVKAALPDATASEANEITAFLKAAQEIQNLLQAKLDSGELPPNTAE